MGASNENRKEAESHIKRARKENSQNLLQSLTQFGTLSSLNGGDETKASFALLLLKKYYLDEREEEKGLW